MPGARGPGSRGVSGLRGPGGRGLVLGGSGPGGVWSQVCLLQGSTPACNGADPL